MAMQELMEHLSLKVPVEVRDQLERIAEREDRTISAVARRLLKQRLAQLEEEKAAERKARSA
jgi:predicted transcriptional regulator